MKQSKGKVKESSREKKQRKRDFADTKRQVYTIVLPALAAVFLFIVAYVYTKTRSKTFID